MLGFPASIDLASKAGINSFNLDSYVNSFSNTFYANVVNSSASLLCRGHHINSIYTCWFIKLIFETLISICDVVFYRKLVYVLMPLLRFTNKNVFKISTCFIERSK